MRYSGVLVICTALCLYTGYAAAQSAPDTAGTLVIIGQVVIYGNEPFTFAGIDGEDGKVYAVYPPEMERSLWSLQGRRIEFTLRVLDRPPDVNALSIGGVTAAVLSWRIAGNTLSGLWGTGGTGFLAKPYTKGHTINQEAD